MDLSRSVLDTWHSFVQQAENNPNSELEIRFSTIPPRDLYKPMEHADYKRPPHYKFKPWIDEGSFHRLYSVLKGLGLSETFAHTDEFLYPDMGVRYVCPVEPSGEPFYLRKSRDRFGGNYDLFQYLVRLSLSQENIVQIAPDGASFPQQQRTKRRWSFVDANRPMIRFDLTKVETDYMTGTEGSRRSSYEVEIEWVRGHRGQVGDLIEACNFVLRVLQASPFVISLPARHNAMNDYISLTTKNHFIGAQPETLQRRHLGTLSGKEYSVTEKIDGERCLMLIASGTGDVFLFTRKMQVRATGLRLVEYAGTLLDIELVRDHEYHVFDLVCFKGNDLRGNPTYGLRERLRICKEIVSAFNCPARVFLKDFVWSIADINKLPQTTYEKDGYILTPVNEPYPTRAGWTSLLKWKPAELNSVDFLLVFDADGTPRVHVGLRDNTTVPFSFCSRVVIDDTLHERQGCIVECVYDSKLKAWTVMRVREDKQKPNYHKVAESVWEAIQDPVSLDDLIGTPTPVVGVNVDEDCTTQTCEKVRASHNRIKSDLITKACASVAKGKLRVLDLGCGRGGDLFKWEKASTEVSEYVGVDVNGAFLEEARRRTKDLKRMKTQFIQADLSVDKLQLDGQFDIVSCQFCFHYFYKSQATLQHFLSLLRRYLRDDGIFIMTTMDGYSVYSHIMQQSKNGLFTLTPKFNTKVGLDVLRLQEYGIGLNIKLQGEESLILQQYELEEYLVFPDLFTKTMSKHGFLLEDTSRFVGTTDLSEDERVFSEMNRSYVFRKKDVCSYQTTDCTLLKGGKWLETEIGGGEVSLLETSYSFGKLLGFITGCDVSEEIQTTDLDLSSVQEACQLNVVFGLLSPFGDLEKYVYPRCFTEDVRVMFVDKVGRVLVRKEAGSRDLGCFFEPSEVVLAKLKGESDGGTSVVPAVSTVGEDNDGGDDFTLLGRRVAGRTKDCWSIKELKDLAKEKGIALQSNMKKMEMAVYISGKIQ